MKQESRTWFDCAYAQARGLLPISIFTGAFERADLERITKGSLNESELQELEKIAAHYLRKLPPEQCFLEEKQRIYPLLAEELKKLLPCVESAISFGSVRGDIDLGLICSCPAKQIIDSIRSSKGVMERYPLVDWESLVFFRSENGMELTAKVAESRRLSQNLNYLPDKEKKYIGKTVLNAMLLYGKSKRLAEMKNGLCRI